MLELTVSFVVGGLFGAFITALCVASARKDEFEPPSLSEVDQRRLTREWTDANLRGDDAARRLVEDEILGRPAQEEPIQPRTR